MRYQQKYRVAVWKTQTQSKAEHRNVNVGYGCDHGQAFWTWHWPGLLRNLYSTGKIKISQEAQTQYACVLNCGSMSSRNWKHRNLCRMSATWSYRNSTAFDKTSGTEQLHSSNLGETFSIAIAVSRTDSIALTGRVLPYRLTQTSPVDLPLAKSLR